MGGTKQDPERQLHGPACHRMWTKALCDASGPTSLQDIVGCLGGTERRSRAVLLLGDRKASWGTGFIESSVL